MTESVLSYLTVLPGSLTERQQFFKKAKDEILDELHDPLIILRQIKSVTKLFESILKDKEIDSLFLDEAEKYGKEFEHAGVKFNIRETGTKYSFQDCNDSQWQALVDQIKDLDKQRKDREAYLKAVPETGVFDQESGEEIHRAPKSSKTSVVVTV